MQEEHHWALPMPSRSLIAGTYYKNLSETMQSFFLRKQTQLKAASTKPTSDSSQESGPAVPWHTGMSKRQEEKSVQYHQERVERSHKIHELYAKQVDVANIARQVGLSRQGVYDYLQMKQPPERTRIHRAGGSQLEPYKDSLIRRWNEGCRSVAVKRDYHGILTEESVCKEGAEHA